MPCFPVCTVCLLKSSKHLYAYFKSFHVSIRSYFNLLSDSSSTSPRYYNWPREISINSALESGRIIHFFFIACLIKVLLQIVMNICFIILVVNFGLQARSFHPGLCHSSLLCLYRLIEIWFLSQSHYVYIDYTI